MKKLLLFSLLLTFVTTANAQGGRKEKIIDNGGSGVYKAEAIEEKTFKEDPVASGNYIERAANIYKNCEVNVVEGGAHGFPESSTHVKANDHIVKFLKNKLKP